MKILIVAATKEEIAPSIPFLEQKEIDFLVTGVGMVATAFALGQKLQIPHYDLIVNVGIAGSFTPELRIGEVVHVTKDRLSELGAEDKESFMSIEDLGFGQSLFEPKPNTATKKLETLRKADGITVNTVHGNALSIQKIAASLHTTTVESMEGAAVFFAAEKSSIAVVQVRAISNYVEPRDKSRWDIPLAVKNLNDWLKDFVLSLGNRSFGNDDTP